MSDVKTCECGCDTPLSSLKKRFVRGHNWKGKRRGKQSEEHVKRLSKVRQGKSSPMKGKRHSKKTREMISASLSLHHDEHPETKKMISESVKRFYDEHPEARERMSLVMKGHQFKDPKTVEKNRQLRRICASMLQRTLDHIKRKKKTRTQHLLGYTADELKNHLENLFEDGMTWENHSRHGWHVDHVRPISSFPKDADPKEINALSNLRPLWCHENWKKKDRWERDDV